jgi:tripartite-type tricarboxylate transporter receptor subunit TctC
MKRRHILQASTCLPLLPLLPATSWARTDFPHKAITWICPYGAGGNADTRSRLVAKAMSEMLGQPIVIENKAGAGGNIGTQAIAKAKPDGYTLGMGNIAPLSVNPSLFSKLSFNPLQDLTPICLIERGPLVLMVRADSPHQSVDALVKAAHAAPGRLSYASGGLGGTHHLSGSLFEHAAGIDMIHAPYKSGAAATSNLLGGQVDLMFELMYAALPGLQSGRLRALAITSAQRSPLLPQVPTMAEWGYPSVEVQNWQGLIGPKGMPIDIVKRLNEVCNHALQRPEVKEKIVSQGNELGGGTPEQFAQLIQSETPRWAKVVKDAKIEAE